MAVFAQRRRKAMIRVVGKSRLPELAEMSLEQPSPEEVAEFRRRSAVYRRNMEWYNAHWSEIVEKYTGQFICVAGGEVFAGADARDVYARAAAKYPEESGVEFGIYLRDDANRSRSCD
jgi:hypothetical protein